MKTKKIDGPIGWATITKESEQKTIVHFEGIEGIAISLECDDKSISEIVEVLQEGKGRFGMGDEKITVMPMGENDDTYIRCIYGGIAVFTPNQIGKIISTLRGDSKPPNWDYTAKERNKAARDRHKQALERLGFDGPAGFTNSILDMSDDDIKIIKEAIKQIQQGDWPDINNLGRKG